MVKIKLDKHKDEIIKLYTVDRLNTVQIANIIGCDNSAIGRFLKRNGIEKIKHTPNELHLSDSDIKAICDEYILGKTTKELGEKYNLCDNTIAKVLKENGVEIRRAARRSAVKNHDFFEQIDSPEKAYFLGWMITDGSVVKSSRAGRNEVISLEIKSDDEYILKLFARCLGANDDIVHRFDKRGHSYIRFSSHKMAEDLYKYGVIPRKTMRQFLPHINDDLMPHLIRGIFDGNGTVTQDKNTKKIAFYGSLELCSEIREYLCDKLGMNFNKVNKSTCFHVWWAKKSQVSSFANYIYNNCGEYYLRRKYNKFYG